MSGAGARQPAENPAEPRRIAMDGQAYTCQQFLDYYGNDASHRWEDAKLAADVTENLEEKKAELSRVQHGSGAAAWSRGGKHPTSMPTDRTKQQKQETREAQTARNLLNRHAFHL